MAKAKAGATETPPAVQAVTPEAPAASEADGAVDGDLSALTGLIVGKLTKPDEKPKEAAPPDDAGDALSQAPETGEAEADAGSARDGEDEPGKETDDEPKGLTPEAQHAFDRRIAKEVEKRKQLETERDEALKAAERTSQLEAELAGLREQLDKPADEGPEHPWLAKANNESELAKVEADARKYERWADRQLERLKFKPAEVEAALKAEKANLDDWSEEAMADYLLRVKENSQDLLEAAPRKRQRFEGRKAYAAAEAQTVEKFKAALPWLTDRKSDAYTAADRVAAQIPGLKSRPEWPVLAAMLIEGGKVIETRLKKPAATPAAATPRKPSSPARPSSEPAPVNALAAQAQSAKAAALESGSEKDIARYLERVMH